MSIRGIRTRAPESARIHGIADLAVMVQFDDLVVAIPAPRVSRIVLADTVDEAPSTSGRPHILLGAQAMPAYDLGGLLGLGRPPAAYLVLTVDEAYSRTEVALGSGPCIAIAAHGPLSRLPRGILTDATGGVIGVFATDAALRGRGVGPLGVRIDPLRLIGATRWSQP